MVATGSGLEADVFEQVFKESFKKLFAYAYILLREESQAEDIVQQVFYKLWLKKDTIQIRQSLQAYLYQAVYNESMNYLKHQKVKNAHREYMSRTSTSEQSSAAQQLAAKELQAKITAALARLPGQCRTVFQLSRFEALKYREIAEKLNLSVKTVENHMGKALKLLRHDLAEYLPLFCVFAAASLLSFF